MTLQLEYCSELRGCTSFPLKFHNVCWLDNAKCFKGALDTWDHVTKFVNEAKRPKRESWGNLVIEKLLRELMNYCVKPDLMKCTGANRCPSMSENQIVFNKVDVGFAAKRFFLPNYQPWSGNKINWNS
ncbi:hypothetical protein PR048_012867 [Dryococelus australis]|uniref:Uncharacterized protein n=1 Tax=Dryococelus australis TaxID=614101 RepID=A0ABQ9HQV1_9NEOP|nr:hypothetical protein PR048_012867 [Dryococelus australis]